MKRAPHRDWAVLCNRAVWCVVLCGFVLGCTPIPRARTLPQRIRSVYVPMFANETAEPGLEELATRATQKEFLADGRLRVEQPNRADAFVECRIAEFKSLPASFEVDDFPSFSSMSIRVVLQVRENLPTAPAIGGERTVVATYTYPSDLRRSVAQMDTEAVKRLMEDLSRQIVREVVTGEFGDQTSTTYSPPAVESDVFRENP